MNPSRSDNGSQNAMDHVMADKTDWQNSVNRNVIGIEPNDSTLLVSTASGDVDGDDPFWSKEQLILIENFPANAFVVMGLIVSIIGIFGIVANGMVLFIFSRFKRLRSPPANTFIINLALSDMSASILHSMAAYSNFNGRWAFGRLGCELYAMGVGFFGFVSILTFSAIACERCLVIAGPATRSSVGLADGHWKVSRTQAQKVCALIWLHCAILVSMPFFGWSSYVPEGMLTSCSWDYTTKTAANRAYYILLLTTGFLLPLMLICASYGRIMASVVWHARQMVCINSQNSAFRKLRRQTEIRTAQIVVTLILVYLTAWTPYAIVTLIGQFGSEDSHLSPMATAIPAYFAKTAVVLDPLVYGFSHPHFRNSLRHFMANLADVAHNNKKAKSSSVRFNCDGVARPNHYQADINSKSWPTGRRGNRNSFGSSYQSRGMTVYPTASACCRTLQGVHGDKSNNQRRMLRTFRDLSVESANVKTSHNANRSPTNVGTGDLEMSTNNCVALIPSIPGTETITQHKANKSPDDPKHRKIVAVVNNRHVYAAVNSFKYKVRNAEFHSECAGLSTLSQIVVEASNVNP